MSQPTPDSAGTLDWVRALADVRNAYEELLGWPVLLEVANRRLVMTTGVMLDAVVMPAALGEQVLAQLRIAMLACPVIAEPDDSWIFTTEPITRPHPAMPPELVAAGVRALPHGSQIELPMFSRLGRSERSWITPCRRQPLAPWHAVIATSRRIIARAADGTKPATGDVLASRRPTAA